jgi:hypothetical protein
MASRVPLLRSGRGERAIAGGVPFPEPPLGNGGSPEARPDERRRTGEPARARLEPSRSGPQPVSATGLRPAHEKPYSDQRRVTSARISSLIAISSGQDWVMPSISVFSVASTPSLPP